MPRSVAETRPSSQSRRPPSRRHWMPCLSPMRIVSLVPHATELLFALGLGDDVVAVTHECDYPEAAALATARSRATCCPAGLSAAEIDAAVRERTERGEAIYELDAERLHELEPDLIVTQALCPVCAVSYDDVRAVAEHDRQPAAGRRAGPAHARRVVRRRAHDRPGSPARARPPWTSSPASARASTPSRVAVRRAERVPVAAIEWLDPVFVAGHWTPQLIELAGGDRRARLRRASTPSRRPGRPWPPPRPRSWSCMPCGYDAERSRAEADALTPTRCATRRRRARRGVDAVGLLLAARAAPGRRPRAARPRPAPRPACPSPPGDGPRGRGLSAAHRPLPALLERPLRRRPPAARDRDRAGPGALPRARRAARRTASWPPTCARPGSRCSCGRWRSCAAR